MRNSLGDASLPAYVAVRAADDRRHVAARAVSWTALDWAVVLYAMFVALVAVVWAVPQWPYILTGHAALVIGLLLLPPRGAAWEEPLPGRVPLAVFRAADGAIPPIHVSGAAADPVLRGSVPHGQRGGGRRPLLVRTVSLRRRPHAVRRRSGRDALAGGQCRPRRGHARLPLLVLHPDHRRHRHRVERRSPYRATLPGVDSRRR